MDVAERHSAQRVRNGDYVALDVVDGARAMLDILCGPLDRLEDPTERVDVRGRRRVPMRAVGGGLRRMGAPCIVVEVVGGAVPGRGRIDVRLREVGRNAEDHALL